MKNQKGQALVETALIIPLLLLLVMGLFDFGRAMYIKNTLNNAARAGARAAVVTPKYDATNPTGLEATTSAQLNSTCSFTNANSTVLQLICNSIYNGIPKNEVAVDIVITDLDPLVTPGLSHGDNVNIKLTWGSFQFITPLGPLTNLIGGTPISTPTTMIGEASMRYE
jgi:Flp pilus assembly protein TadG